MVKKIIFVFLLVSSTCSVFAADDDCEAAVDAANRLNPNEDKHCDYTNTGLNGVLHRAFANKSDSVNEDSSKASAESTKTPANAEAKVFLVNNEFTSAQQLQTLRYALVQKAAQECRKGFIVEGDRYLPRTKGMTVELIYHCL
jgi:hypothetical protein